MTPTILFLMLLELLKQLAIYALFICVPAFLIKMSNRSMSFWTAFAVSCLVFFLPFLSMVFNSSLVDEYYAYYEVWGLPNLDVFGLGVYALAGGAIMAYLHSGILLGFSKERSKGQILFFAWLAFLLDAMSLIGLPWFLYGEIADDDLSVIQLFFSVSAFLLLFVTVYLFRSKNIKELFLQEQKA